MRKQSLPIGARRLPDVVLVTIGNQQVKTKPTTWDSELVGLVVIGLVGRPVAFGLVWS